MRIRFFGCGKFSWLASAAEDRLLMNKERHFMDRHRAVCLQCMKREEASALALNMLREARLEVPTPESAYDVRLLRRLRIQSMRSASYWSPAFFGAAIAAVSLVSALQLLSRSGDLPVFHTGTSEAVRIRVGAPEFPNIPIAERILNAQ